jgi:hypothetical protein
MEIHEGDPRGVFYDIEDDPEVAARLTAQALQRIAAEKAAADERQ